MVRRTRHGLGTFVAPLGRNISTVCRRFQSMSETIRSHGLEPEMQYHRAEVRAATADEAESLQCAVGAEVFATRRAVLADGEVLAFSHDEIPPDLLGHDVDPAAVTGSLFDTLGVHTGNAVAEMQAVVDDSIGWGSRPADGIFLWLDQVHHTDDAVPVLASKTYFYEGRFQFSVLRVR